MKKVLCILLSVLLLLPALSLCASAAAGPAEFSEEKVENALPLVIVRGMDFTDGLKYDFGTENERTVNVMNNLSVGGVMKGLARGFTALVTRGRRAAVTELVAFAATLFEGYACDENGDSLDPRVTGMDYPLSVDHYPELWEGSNGHEGGLVHSAADRYGADKVYYLMYDWRLDALENAAKLNEMVERACEEHASAQVNLVCCSMGGLVTLAYLGEYGSARIHSLVSNSSVMYGTDVTSELLTGKIDFNEDAAYRFLIHKFSALKNVFTAAYKTGLMGKICRFLNRFAETYHDEIYSGVLIPVFGSMPALWEIVRPEVYDEAKAYIFGSSDSYAGLRAKTDRVQYGFCANLQSILDTAMQNGMLFGVLANYDTPLVPAYASAPLQGDGTLETRRMSFGALVSTVGGKLSEEELAVGEPKYVSADGCINASTCLYRDMTWFCKDCVHVACGYHSDYTYLVFSVLEADTQPTVETWEKYPQFMQADGKENLTPVTAAPGKWDAKETNHVDTAC